MANINDYVDWRGDLSYTASPFNEVDNLIFSQLVYIDFREVITDGGEMTLREVGRLINELHPQGIKPMGLMRTALMNDLLNKCAASERFGNVRIAMPECCLDEESQEQFAATVFIVNDDLMYIAFRGTDQTLVGWKEDFNMAFICPVPSQLRAVAYVERAAVAYPECRIICGGHSKGGNLAVYSSAYCKEGSDRITAIYNNDGPGFPEDAALAEEIDRIAPRIISLVPQGSVVGMLLEHREAYSVVKSAQHGILQHDAFSWDVMGAELIHLTVRSKQSIIIDKALTDWINSMSVSEREAFVSALYEVLSATDAVKLSDLTSESMRILKSIKNMDPHTRELMVKAIKALRDSTYRSAKEIFEADKQGSRQLPDKGRKADNVIILPMKGDGDASE